MWCRKQRRCLVRVFLSLILTFGCAFFELGALKLNCFLLYYINVEHCKRILGPQEFWDTPIFRFCTIVQLCIFLFLSFTGKMASAILEASLRKQWWFQLGSSSRGCPGPLYPQWRVFSGFVASQTFFHHFSTMFQMFFVPWKFPRCWVAAYGMMTTALWTLRSRNFCNFEPSPDNWGLAMSHPHIWLVLQGEADTGESRKLKIWGWNTLKRQVSEDKSLHTCENNLLWTSLGGSFEIILLAATSFSAQMLEISSHILLFESLISFDIDHFVIQSRRHLPLCRWAGLGLLSSRWTVPCQCFKKKVFWLEGKEMWLRFFDLRKLKDFEGKRWKLWSKGRWGEFHRNRFPRGIALGMVV